jgi:hypothetical protein
LLLLHSKPPSGTSSKAAEHIVLGRCMICANVRVVNETECLRAGM